MQNVTINPTSPSSSSINTCPVTVTDTCGVPKYMEKYMKKRLDRRFNWCDDRTYTGKMERTILKAGGWGKV